MLNYHVHVLSWANAQIARGAVRSGLAMLNIGAMVPSYIVHLLLLLSEGRHIECIALAVAVEGQAY